MIDKLNKLWNWKTKTLLVGLALIVSWIACLKIGFELKKYNSITNLPNSCFVDAMIYASRCNLLLVTTSDSWNSVYGFTFGYKDDKEAILGHAVCVFEYNNNIKTGPSHRIFEAKEKHEDRVWRRRFFSPPE
jgi:hypothetical protein